MGRGRGSNLLRPAKRSRGWGGEDYAQGEESKGYGVMKSSEVLKKENMDMNSQIIAQQCFSRLTSSHA
jgi:hypothetical protein